MFWIERWKQLDVWLTKQISNTWDKEDEHSSSKKFFYHRGRNKLLLFQLSFFVSFFCFSISAFLFYLTFLESLHCLSAVCLPIPLHWRDRICWCCCCCCCCGGGSWMEPPFLKVAHPPSSCLLSSDIRLKVLPHVLQQYFLTSEWVWRCARKLLRSANAREHSVHWKGFSPVGRLNNWKG